MSRIAPDTVCDSNIKRLVGENVASQIGSHYFSQSNYVVLLPAVAVGLLFCFCFRVKLFHLHLNSMSTIAVALLQTTCRSVKHYRLSAVWLCLPVLIADGKTNFISGLTEFTINLLNIIVSEYVNKLYHSECTFKVSQTEKYQDWCSSHDTKSLIYPNCP